MSIERVSKCFQVVFQFGETTRRPCHLERGRVPVYRDEGESKDPENACSSMLIRGVLPRDCPRTSLSPWLRHQACRAEWRGCSPELVVEDIAHAERRSKGRLGRTPRIGIAEDKSSGSFDAPSVSRFAGSFVLAQDHRPWGSVQTTYSIPTVLVANESFPDLFLVLIS